MNENRVLVVGGTRGLGAGVARALAAAGSDVVVAGRDTSAIHGEAWKGITALTLDATAEGVATSTLRRVEPDALILVAGARPVMRRLTEHSWETFAVNWNVDMKLAFEWMKAALLHPGARLERVVTFSSGAALFGSPLSGGYAPAKRGQWLISDYAAREAKKSGKALRFQVLVPALNPSTELGREAIAAYAAEEGVTPDAYAQRLGAPLTPAIAGHAVVELLAQGSTWVEPGYRLTGAGLLPLPKN